MPAERKLAAVGRVIQAPQEPHHARAEERSRRPPRDISRARSARAPHRRRDAGARFRIRGIDVTPKAFNLAGGVHSAAVHLAVPAVARLLETRSRIGLGVLPPSLPRLYPVVGGLRRTEPGSFRIELDPADCVRSVCLPIGAEVAEQNVSPGSRFQIAGLQMYRIASAPRRWHRPNGGSPRDITDRLSSSRFLLKASATRAASQIREGRSRARLPTARPPLHRHD